MIFDSGLLPDTWKKSSIVPVPKITNAKERNDFRPVALTSNIMKCFERLMLTQLLKQTKEFMDPFQFAYRPNRSVEDAVQGFAGGKGSLMSSAYIKVSYQQ